MKLGTEDRKKLAVLIVAGLGAVGAIGYMSSQLFPSTPAVPAPVVSTVAPGPVAQSPAASRADLRANAARPVPNAEIALDPSLHMGPMLVTEALQYRGNGRNIFSTDPTSPLTSATLPRPTAPARPTPGQTVTLPTGPVGPPPIDLRFFGTASGRGQSNPRAFLLRGEDVYLASVGDIVQRRYKVISITASSLTVQDLADNRQQVLPLAAN